MQQRPNIDFFMVAYMQQWPYHEFFFLIVKNRRCHILLNINGGSKFLHFNQQWIYKEYILGII